MMTPEDIHDKQFKIRLRGYSITEVNDFLDQLNGDYSELVKQVRYYKARNKQLSSWKKTYEKRVSSISQAIVVGQAAANKIKRQAQKKADREASQIIGDALSYKRSSQEAAHRNSQALIKNAKWQASRDLLQSREEWATIQARISHLHHRLVTYKQTLKKSLLHQLKSLDDGPKVYKSRGKNVPVLYYPNGVAIDLDTVKPLW